MISDDNLCFSFVWKPKKKPAIEFWMLHEGETYRSFFCQNGFTFYSEGISGASLLADAIRAAGLGDKEREMIFDRLKSEMRKSAH